MGSLFRGHYIKHYIVALAELWWGFGTEEGRWIGLMRCKTFQERLHIKWIVTLVGAWDLFHMSTHLLNCFIVKINTQPITKVIIWIRSALYEWFMLLLCVVFSWDTLSTSWYRLTVSLFHFDMVHNCSEKLNTLPVHTSIKVYYHCAIKAKV